MAEALGLERLSIRDPITPQEDEVKNLTTQASIEFIAKENRPLLILMRGVPGSGKSTIVQHLMHRLKTDAVCSADQYFMRDGKYNFDRSKLREAHNGCQQKAQQLCEQQSRVVIIDNTQVKTWETKAYIQLAKTYGYVVIMLVPLAQHTASPQTLAQRNSHGVDAETIQQKLHMFEEYNPSYFAWFFGKTAAANLAEIRERWVTKVRGLGLLNFAMGKESTSITHMTALHLSNVRENRKADITKKLLTHVGQVNRFEVPAIVITKRTVSARVKLTAEALKWFLNDGPTDETYSHRAGYEDLPKGHSAHITLGTADELQAEVARSDMILSHLCNTKMTIVEDNLKFYSDDELVLIELNPPLHLTGIFAGSYSLRRTN
ncbi:2',3'-cyclic-nucleotide 3'-phosphodiesterase-like [Watersipora subatra]|uniref:2',3'-cyclic-nucleotide 3'-phosphodiesterase-like n=1 Tax=Watersipora subatra TaxID=2589382 RepID=UPI00355BFA5B